MPGDIHSASAVLKAIQSLGVALVPREPTEEMMDAYCFEEGQWGGVRNNKLDYPIIMYEVIRHNDPDPEVVSPIVMGTFETNEEAMSALNEMRINACIRAAIAASPYAKVVKGTGE